jgi:hypothetical protein
MGERDLARLSEGALADCFGRLDSERATLQALRSTIREEILRRRADSLVGRSFVVSVASSNSYRWDLEAVSRELGMRAELFRRTVATTYVRSRSLPYRGGKEWFDQRLFAGRDDVFGTARQ